MSTIEALIVGGGVVGNTPARELALQLRSQNLSGIGTGTMSPTFDPSLFDQRNLIVFAMFEYFLIHRLMACAFFSWNQFHTLLPTGRAKSLLMPSHSLEQLRVNL
ncbi:hypothetical protein HG15A2_37260 [Adhaeretor mobilis]|uniref:Uncharacterized protein n=1 Tax=Adhaeretor mobilis TaxID=1930276 RepID=A0A517MZS8_9BACT|nr:hypothetical protein HG15A2_37260 [Adhaeretor mobilis]